jgi:hypothetical protein
MNHDTSRTFLSQPCQTFNQGEMHFDSAMARGHVAGSDSAFAGFARNASFLSPCYPHRLYA